MKRILTLTAAAAIALTLSACQLYALDSKEDVLEYALIATDGSELEILEEYPNLKYLDLRGSTCYDAILTYSASHPEVKVRFSIDLGRRSFNQDVTEIKLTGSDASVADLMTNLKYFPFLKTVHIDRIAMSKVQFDELKTAYPQINFSCTVKIGSEVYDESVSELNLSAISSSEMNQVLAALEFLPNLSSVDLVDSAGESKVTPTDANRLMQAYPHLSVHYQIHLFGQILSLDTETIAYKDVKIGNDGLDKIREALVLMPNVQYICLDNCSIDNEALAEFRDDFPKIKTVWRIFAGQYSVMTDTEVILMQNTVTNYEAQALKYCTNVKYLDVSGCKIQDFSFLSNMPNLECVVIAQTLASDLSGLSNCSNLTWLDLSGCSSVRDISPLSGLKNLKYLNISATKVKSLAALDHVPIERFKNAKSSINGEELSRFEESHPNCLITRTGTLTGKGWRFDDSAQQEPFAYYVEMIKAFGYNK